MNNSERRLLRITDVLIIVVVAVVGLALFFGGKSSSGNPVAVITVDGEETRRIDLISAENETITLNTLPEVTLEIKDSKIRFVNSLCPDKTCEKSGFLSEVGDTAGIDFVPRFTTPSSSRFILSISYSIEIVAVSRNL